MGDPAGIGPELCLRILARNPESCRLQVYGNTTILQRVAQCANIPLPPNAVIVDDPELDANEVIPGTAQAICGAAAARAITTAVRDAQDGKINALVTAPINKSALHAAGVSYPGHTEMLAECTHTPEVCMLMASKDMNVCLVTTHLALRNVPDRITQNRIETTIKLANQAMQQKGIPHPRITVCGLNPHAGEAGAFGREEEQVILPAVQSMQRKSYTITGPLPADTAFIPEIRKKTDVYIVMYHDQGLIPFKMLAFETGVNVTLGLPIIRTSPDHGTAFDIAWQGKANDTSMHQAVLLAAQLASL
jgi:4-hydroxythreonine-4-phosphate dehydrogenase